MKKNIIFGVFVIIQTLFISCDRVDDNGKLYGQWQLTEWKNKEGKIVQGTDYCLFYSINLELLYMQRKQYLDKYIDGHEGIGKEWRCTFSHVGDKLKITNVCAPKANADIRLNDEDINGGFTCDTLNIQKSKKKDEVTHRYISYREIPDTTVTDTIVEGEDVTRYTIEIYNKKQILKRHGATYSTTKDIEFQIKSLTNDNLILVNSDLDTLRFRKY